VVSNHPFSGTSKSMESKCTPGSPEAARTQVPAVLDGLVHEKGDPGTAVMNSPKISDPDVILCNSVELICV
jgi:hypothetical protein